MEQEYQMHTFIVEVNNDKALKTLQALEQIHAIRIVSDTDFDTPSLPGKVLSINEFRNWVNAAEHAPSISLKEAKEKWAGKQKQLQKLTR